MLGMWFRFVCAEFFIFIFCFVFFTNWQMLPDEGWIAGGDLVDVSM